MKVLLLLTFVAIGHCAILGSKKCTYGPSYWCSHIDHARECKAMQHCLSTVWKNQFQGLTGLAESCFDGIKILDEVRQSGDEDQLTKMAESCTKMTGEKHSVCKNLMMNNWNEVRLLLQSDLPSMNVAAALGLCGGLSNSVQHPKEENKPVELKAGNYCTDCLNFFTDLQEIINNTEGKIAEKLKSKICTRLGRFENLCNRTVDTYTDFIIQFLAQQLNPQDMCFLFQLCEFESSADFALRLEHAAAKVLQVDKDAGDYCTDCVNFFTDLQEIVNNTEGKIAEKLKSKICTRLGRFESLCNKTVDIYTDFIIQFLAQQLNPQDLCYLLHFCPSESSADFVMRLEQAAEKMQFQNEGCETCQTIAKDLQNILRDPTLQSETIYLLRDEACPLLPGSLVNSCKTYVSQYGYVAIQVLIAELDPVNICQTLGFCKSTETKEKLTIVPLAKALSTVHLKAPEPQRQASPLCALCELVMNKIENLIGKNATKAEIEKVLGEVCSLLPRSLKAECDSFVTQYGPVIVDLLLKIAPNAVCTTLGLCVVDQPVPAVEHSLPVSVPVKGPSSCEICKLLAGYGQDILKDPRTEGNLAFFLENVCTLVPTSLKDVCGDFMRTIAEDFVDMLYQADDPEKVCTSLNYCEGEKRVDKKSEDHPLTFVPLAMLKPAVAAHDDLCDQGPEVWCASMENAKHCNAVEYCAENKLKMEG